MVWKAEGSWWNTLGTKWEEEDRQCLVVCSEQRGMEGEGGLESRGSRLNTLGMRTDGAWRCVGAGGRGWSDSQNQGKTRPTNGLHELADCENLGNSLFTPMM